MNVKNRKIATFQIHPIFTLHVQFKSIPGLPLLIKGNVPKLSVL